MSTGADSRKPRDDTAVGLARGTSRLLLDMGYTCITEFTLASGRRADVAAIDRKGKIVIVEVKTSLADFRADTKWREYRDYCDRLYFAVPGEFPIEVLPEDTGVMIADRFGAEEIRPAPPASEQPMHASRRREILIRFARTAANRLQALTDPRPN